MKKLLFVLFVLLIASEASAQVSLLWDETAPSLATANSYVYKYYPNAETNGIVLNPVTCTGAISPYTCKTPVPPFAPGTASFTMTAASQLAESIKSAPYNFPTIFPPKNIRQAAIERERQLRMRLLNGN